MADQPITTSRDTDMPNRRTVLRAAGITGVGATGAGVLAACGLSGSTSSGSGGAVANRTAVAASVKAADVPVGGGVINPDALFVVTQPTAGTYKAFSAVCTHQGCTVTKVTGGMIDCPCHGSQFDISTGKPTSSSPAKKALPTKTATLNGDTITVT
ncbi:MAG: Rieske (2Fe-2S) protein [Actinomycetota bacterium]|nr:Rieske (2Fe-2S) protein [Actinomycetota bacterium]